MVNKKKESFLLYLEHEELVNELSDEDAGKLFKCLFNYVATGNTPDISGMQKMAFITIRQDLDRNAKKYEEVVEKRRIAGSKGGLQRAINQANANFAKKIEPNQADNVYENDNDNDNVLSHNEENRISREDREILEKYIERKKLANKNVKAYANKLITNGDYKPIVEQERKRLKPEIAKEERIKRELASIKDKRSCAKVLAGYYSRGEPPAEFSSVMQEYDLDSYDKVFDYAKELSGKYNTENR